MQQEENRKCHRNEAADIEKRRYAAWSTASDMYRRGPVPYSRSGTSSMRDPPNLSPQRHQGPERSAPPVPSEICVHLRRQNLELKSQLRRISLWAPSSLWDDGVPWCWARQAGRSCSEDEVLSLSCLSLLLSVQAYSYTYFGDQAPGIVGALLAHADPGRSGTASAARTTSVQLASNWCCRPASAQTPGSSSWGRGRSGACRGFLSTIARG